MTIRRKQRPPRYLGPRAEAQRRRDAAHVQDAESRRELLRDLKRIDKKLDEADKEIRRQKRIKPVSKKLSARKQAYYKLRDLWLVGKLCHCCITPTPATECHHISGRVGRLLLYVPLWLPLCAFHHAEVHREPARARQMGLLAPMGLWNEQRQVPRDYVPSL